MLAASLFSLTFSAHQMKPFTKIDTFATNVHHSLGTNFRFSVKAAAAEKNNGEKRKRKGKIKKMMMSFGFSSHEKYTFLFTLYASADAAEVT